MGQKIHPVGLRLGITRTWDSRWFEKKNYQAWLHEDVAIRKYFGRMTRAAAISKVEIERRANQARVIVHTGKPGIIIGKRGVGIDDIRRTSRSSPARSPGQRRRDQASRARCPSRRPEHRRPAREAHRVPPRHEARHHAHDEGRRARREGASLGSPRRRGNRAHRTQPRRQGAAAHAARRHRLRARRSVHDLRPHRRESLDLQGRSAAGSAARRTRSAPSAASVAQFRETAAARAAAAAAVRAATSATSGRRRLDTARGDAAATADGQSLESIIDGAPSRSRQPVRTSRARRRGRRTTSRPNTVTASPPKPRSSRARLAGDGRSQRRTPRMRPSATNRSPNGSRGELSNADSQTRQVAQRQHRGRMRGKALRRQHADVRRVRSAGARAGAG